MAVLMLMRMRMAAAPHLAVQHAHALAPRQHVEQRRLAGAAGAQQRKQVAGAHAAVHALRACNAAQGACNAGAWEHGGTHAAALLVRT